MPPHPAGRARPASFVLALCLGLAPRGASAEPALFGTGEVVLGGGHDDNILLQVSPEAGLRETPVGGWFGRAAPTLTAAVTAGRWRIEASYALDWRRGPEAGDLVLQQAEVSASTPRLGPVHPRLALSVGRFDAPLYPGDWFVFAGAEAGMRIEITGGLRAAGSYRAELRRFPDRPGGEQLDLVHIGELRLGYRPDARLEMGLGSSYLGLVPARAAVVDDGYVRFLRLGPDLELVWRRLTLIAGGWGGALALPSTGRHWQYGAGVGLIVRLTRNLDVTVVGDWASTPSGDPAARNYSRRYLGLGLVAHVTGKAALPRAEETDLRPVVRDGRVRLRVRAADAEVVEVIGSWDDWATGVRRLSPTRDGALWEAWVELPPGTWRYHFVVDGRAVRPPDAPRYVADGFGGEDAVIEVP